MLPLAERDAGPFPGLGLLPAWCGPTVFLVNRTEATPERLAGCVTVPDPSFAALAAEWRID